MRTSGWSVLASRLWRVASSFAVCWTLIEATPAFAQMTFTIHSPKATTLHGYPEIYDDPVPIAVQVNSPTEVLSVQATVGTRTTALTFTPGQPAWVGSLSLDGLPRGEYTIVFEATNSGGQTAQGQGTFTFDKRPVLTLTAPAQFAVGQPDIPVAGQCVDDGPSCLVTVATNLRTLLVASGSFNTVVTPPAGEHDLTIRATDATGRYVEVTRHVFVSSKGGLSIAGTFQGTLLDVDAARALTFDDTVTPSVVRLHDRAANTSQIIWTGPVPDTVFPTRVNKGFLTPNNGALFVVETQADIIDPLFEWRSGALTQVGNATSYSLIVKGAWAVFNGAVGPNGSGHAVFLRDLTAGTNIQSPADGGDPDVTPDGRAVFFGIPTPHEVFEFDPSPAPGTVTQLTSAGPLWSVYPRTDGVNVIFVRSDETFTSPKSIVLRTAGGTEEVLATGLNGIGSGTHYRVAGGWTAFLRPGSGGSVQAWIREPDGTLRQLSSTGGHAQIDALSENGDVAFTTRTSVPGGSQVVQQYIRFADGTVREMGPSFGHAGQFRFIDGAPFIVAGNQLLAVGAAPLSRSILSEGATGTFFSTDVALLNPAATEVPVTLRYFREGQPEIQDTRTLPARSRTTIHLDDVPGLESAAVSTQVDAPAGSTVVAERLMSWNATGYGGHLGNAVNAPRRKWLFAEGAQGFFSTFFLLANSGTEDATVRFTFLVEQGDPVEHTMTVPGGSRKTFNAGELAALVNHSFATIVDADLPIVAERAMYFGSSPLWLGGHGSAGVAEPAYSWYHAEGATGALFDTFILIANPNPTETQVSVTFNTDTGVPIFRMKTIPPFGRLTINIEEEAPELASTAVSTRVTAIGSYNSGPIVSERAMYWGTTGDGWREAHNSFGVTEPGLKWGLAEGRVGGDRGYQTYVLVSNGNGTAANLKVTFIRENGTAIEKTYTAGPGERLNIPTLDVPELANSNFATIVESINGVTINVESAIYWNSGGVVWEAGGNTVATPIP
jgi:hypothetical protein